MKASDKVPSISPENAISTSQSNTTPEGFSISTDAISEEAWEEIRLYLGLTTIPHPFGAQNGKESMKPRILIDGFGDQSNDKPNKEGCDLNIPNAMASTEIPWESTPFPQNRPVAQFGFRYDYEKDVVVPPRNDDDTIHVDEKPVPKIPEVFQRLLLQPHLEKIETQMRSVEFTQCIINVYHPSTARCSSSIPWHFDDPNFGPEILVFTFGETRPLHMRLKRDNTADSDKTTEGDTKNGSDNDNFSYFTAHPSHCSCYILSGPARYQWQHSVPSGSSWRVSITFRTLCPS